MSNFFANPAAATAEAAPPPKRKPVPQPAPQPEAAPPVVSPTPALDAVTAQPTRPVNAPAATPPAKPTLQKVTGPPVPALAAQGWYGSIHDFNDRVQAVTDTYHTATGAAPKPAYVLAMAKSQTPTDQLSSAVVGSLRPPGSTGPVPSDHIDAQDSHKLLEGLKGNAAAGGYDQFMQRHGQQIQALLSDPATKAAATAALAQAKDADRLGKAQDAAPGTLAAVKEFTVRPVVAAAKTTVAAATDIGNLDHALATGNNKQVSAASAMPNLTATAPAVAQVVKGLVYAPAGMFDVAKALALDAAEFEKRGLTLQKPGPFMPHTAKLASEYVRQVKQDVNDPSHHAGDLMLDIWGVTSLGVGAAARVGRFGEVAADGGAVAGAKAAAGQHPLRTFRMEKNGFGEDLKLAASPLTAWLQEFTPVVGYRAIGKRLGEDRVSTNLFGASLSSLGPQDRFSDWAQQQLSRLSGEGMIGRAGNIRRGTEYKARLGLKAELDASSNAAAGDSRLVATLRFLPGGQELANRFRGLSRGEQKALQALSWDDPHPIAAEERFHQSMIEQGIGDEADHKRQLGELKLARQALENPSPRFQKVLDAYLRVVSETERMRIQMGLGEDTADQRIAKAGAILRGEEVKPGEPLERQSATSWYTPVTPKGKPRARLAVESTFQRGKSLFGFGPPQGTNLFGHEMTGSALRAGDFRTDAHHLAGEGYAKTVRAVQVLDEFKKAWENATPTKTGDYDIPVRDIRGVPDELRKAYQQFFDGHIDAATAEGLPDEVHKWLFPPESDEMEHVRYIDPRLLGNAAKPNIPAGWFAKTIAEPVNNLLRPWILYGPKYILNRLGNDAMLALDQGFLRAGQNLARAMSADENLSPEAHARLKSLTGAGRSESYVNPRSGVVSQALADYWARITDNGERMASWLYYADRNGYRTWPEIENLLLNEDDATVKAHRVDTTRRGDDALVAFDRMTPWEKATLRHYIFVYPWQRGATIWAFRTVFEHPAKTAVLNQLGQEAIHDDEWLRHAVKWVRDVGYIPLYWAGVNPVVIDPTSVNSFSTLAQILQTVKAGVEGDKYASMGDLLGPPGQFLVHGALGIAQNGQPYPGGQWVGAAEEALNILPLVAAVERNQKGVGKLKTLPPFDVTNRASLQTRLNAALKQVVLTPGWLDGFGNLLIGGFSGRELNLNAAAARYWRDATPAQRHARTVDLLLRGLNMQAEFLKQPVPAGVRAAVKDAAQITWLGQQFQKTQGRSPTLKEKLLLTIGYFRDAGRIDAAEAKKLDQRANKLEAVSDINAMASSVHALYGNAKALYQWDHDVSTVAGLRNPANLNERVAVLFANGLADQRVYKTTEPQRVDYGRGYIAYQAARAKLAAEVKAGAATEMDLKVFDDQHDAPQGRLPSYSRLRLTEGASAAAQKRIDALANSSWGSLSGVEKAALGRKVAPNISYAWADYKIAEKQIRAAGGNMGAPQKLALAKIMAKRYPGFMQDWLYSQQAKGARFEYTDAYKSLPDKTLFDQYVMSQAKVLIDAVKAAKQDGSTGAQTRANKVWRDYVDTQIKPWLKDHPQLAAALVPFGKSFLDTLVGVG